MACSEMPEDADHIKALLCELLQHMLTLELKLKLETTSPRHPHQSYSTIPTLTPVASLAVCSVPCVLCCLLPQLFHFLLTSPPILF